LRQNENHCVVVVFEGQTQNLGSGRSLNVTTGNLSEHVGGGDSVVRIVSEFEESLLLKLLVELFPPLRVEVQHVDQEQARVRGDAAWNSK